MSELNFEMLNENGVEVTESEMEILTLSVMLLLFEYSKEEARRIIATAMELILDNNDVSAGIAFSYV